MAGLCIGQRLFGTSEFTPVIMNFVHQNRVRRYLYRLVDFNLAYNPYCAYNDQFSCPLTPFENRLKVPIRAGEKIFHEE
jgi:uncharacterized protein (DUF1684 family)